MLHHDKMLMFDEKKQRNFLKFEVVTQARRFRFCLGRLKILRWGHMPSPSKIEFLNVFLTEYLNV